MNNRFTLVISLFFLAITFNACLKDDDAEKREKEKSQIATYVKNHSITATPSSSGLYYISETTGTGSSPADDDFVLIKYKATDLDGNYYDGTDTTEANSHNITPYFVLGGPFKIYMGGFMSGVTEGLKNMKEGGKATMIMPSALAYNDYVPRIIEVELIKVVTSPKAYEQEQITNYLDSTVFNTGNLTLADSLSNGIYYFEKSTGTGTTNPSSGSVVKVKYTGYLPDGRLFDKSSGLTFTVGTGSAISGLDNGIRKMTEGGKAVIVIPYYKGYGFNQLYGQDTQGYYHVVLPYFSSLVYHIELLDVSK